MTEARLIAPRGIEPERSCRVEAAMIIWKYILLFICLGIGAALCIGAISILRSPYDNGPPAWFAAVLGVMFFWGAFALARWRRH